MTSKQLWDKCIPGVKQKSPVSFEFAKKQNIAIDINCFLHGLCFKQPNALLMTFVPPYSPNDVIITLETWNEVLKQHYITPYSCF